MRQTHVEAVGFPRVPSYCLNIAAKHGADTYVGCSRVERPYSAVVRACQQHTRLRRIPLHGLHLVFVHVEAPYRAPRLAIFTPVADRWIAAQIPQLHRAVRASTRKQIPLRAIPAEVEDGVDVVRLLLRAVLRLLFLFLARAERGGYVCFRLVWAAEDARGVHRLERVEVPDLNLGIEGADGDVVARGAFGGGRGGGGEVEPFEAEGEVGEHEVVVAVEVLLRVVVNVDFELRDLVFGLGDDDEVVSGEDLELFALVIVFGVLEMMSGGRDVAGGLRTSLRVMYGSSLLSL